MTSALSTGGAEIVVDADVTRDRYLFGPDFASWRRFISRGQKQGTASSPDETGHIRIDPKSGMKGAVDAARLLAREKNRKMPKITTIR